MAEALFWNVLEHLQTISPKFGIGRQYSGVPRRFKRLINAVDATTIKLFANCMDWAKHRRRKAAVKMHLNLNLQSFLPRFIVVEKAKHHDATQAMRLCSILQAGEIVLFDRSWYNRGGVEPVMGFCTQEEHKEFLREVPEFEKMLVNSGIIIFKFYFSVSKKEQERRFEKRRTDPLKQYKLSPVDEKSQDMWDKYTIAKYSMLLASHTDHAPWTIVRSDNKKKARINCIKHILTFMDYPGKISDKKLKADGNIKIDASEEIRIMETEMTLKKNSI
jgi:hypothetical protein